MKGPKHGDRKFILRDWVPGDAESIAKINNTEIPSVTQISPDELIKLAGQAFHFRMVEQSSGEIAGFVLALDEKAVYASLNFRWFKSRYPSFSYVAESWFFQLTKGAERGGSSTKI